MNSVYIYEVGVPFILPWYSIIIHFKFLTIQQCFVIPSDFGVQWVIGSNLANVL